MQVSPITSRPLYGRLKPQVRARQHIALTEGAGLSAFEEAFGALPDILVHTTLIHIANPSDAALATRLEKLGVDSLHMRPTRETALVKLRAVLSGAGMGARLYVAGDEDFIGPVQALALEVGMMGEAIQAEHRGSLARRVQCVHCKGFNDDVMVSPFTCRHCGTHLLVRDHFSRRLGAFMGVVIDAEAPGDVPPVETLQPVPVLCAEGRP